LRKHLGIFFWKLTEINGDVGGHSVSRFVWSTMALSAIQAGRQSFVDIPLFVQNKNSEADVRT